MKKLLKPKVKLLTLWVLDWNYQSNQPSDNTISHGIWETIEVEVLENKTGRVYTLVCVSPNHPSLKVGDKRRMYESVIIELCHRVVIRHLPKLKSMIRTERKKLNKK